MEIKAKVIFELVGKPKEHVEETLQGYIEKLKDDEQIKILDQDVKEAVETEQEMFSAFAEVTMEFKNASTMFGVCMDYMPASVEIEEPEDIQLTNAHVSDLTNDFIRRLHQADYVAKAANQKNKVMSQSLGVMIQNAIMLALKGGLGNPDQISKVLGVERKQLDVFLNKLVKDGRAVEKEGVYSLGTKA